MPKISRGRRRKPGEKQARVRPQKIGYTDAYRRWLIGWPMAALLFLIGGSIGRLAMRSRPGF